ncbi:hypothetical protein HGP16_20875 [Rhizobium sp. P40RR-XXII]|uniref:alpha/beta hydrolase family protein n=1 Tax=unclassified Rhizobium TaxID=2613769 RepID=UPI0014571260|nr:MULTISPECIES: hypothetical protein [unclassified Rhizobium]NLR88102.1 hypothetical protein [Rhizobium sp. P28RR-XV]NLS18998.1 hypothetical protein [Rhizobium sp. P40RR-XXII]
MPVGFSQGLSFDRKRANWSSTGRRPLAWCAWYPADDNAVEIAPSPTWFKQKPVAPNAPMKKSTGSHPLVLLSHGSGGLAIGLEWLGHRLAQAGFVALGLDHHGHTGSEPYRAEGFLCLWERAADLTALLNADDWREVLGGVVEDQAYVAGFSAGAYTAMLLVGARVAYSQFEPDNPRKSPIRGPKEFPDLADYIPSLLLDGMFLESWNRRRDSFKDDRLKAALAIAPGRSVLGFARESLEEITAPVKIIGGDADVIAPAHECCTWLHKNVRPSSLEIMSGGVGHYSFLPEPTQRGLEASPAIFTDIAGLVRENVHNHVAQMAIAFFSTVR